MCVLHHKSDGYEAAYTDRNRSAEWKYSRSWICFNRLKDIAYSEDS